MKKNYELRFRLKLESKEIEAALLDYLKEYPPTQSRDLVMKALRTLLLPRIYERQGRSPEEIRHALLTCDYMWRMHFLDLQQELGIHLDPNPFDQIPRS